MKSEEVKGVFVEAEAEQKRRKSINSDAFGD